MEAKSLIALGTAGMLGALIVTMISGKHVDAQTGLAVGRYQVVNGTPDSGRNIMLLDTVQGISWIVCDSDTNGVGWCRMPKTDNTAAAPKP